MTSQFTGSTSSFTKKGEEPSHPYEHATPQHYEKKFKNRKVSEFVDPCEKAAKASMDCLNRNDYNRDSCTDYFQAYRDCKKTWMEQLKADRRAGKTTV
ncbi:cysteine alpha-hairpin motif superfamily [Abortiporus biennis]|nr:cysteine alpha-hairpin motif superfamily [Abortiporus biennis]